MSDLHDYNTGDFIRKATREERNASRAAAKFDGGPGVILIDETGVVISETDSGSADAQRCYVQE